MFLMTLRDLQYRAVRFGVAILGTALVFSLVLIMSGLSLQFRREPKRTVSALRADRWVVVEDVTGPFSAGSDTVPLTLGDELRTSGAERASPIIITRKSVKVAGETSDVMVFGFEIGWPGKPPLVRGHQISGRGEIVASEELGLSLGRKIRMGKLDLEIVGLTRKMTIFGGTPLVYLDYPDAQEIVFRNQPTATAFLVQGKAAPPKGFKALSNDAVAEDAFRVLDKPVAAIDLVQFLLWIVATSIIGVVVYLSALERARDFAVMKAVGASSKGLLSGLAAQSVIVAVTAALLSFAIQAGLVPLFPIPISVPARAYVQLPIIALVAGVAASLGGLRKAVRVDPALAFQGP